MKLDFIGNFENKKPFYFGFGFGLMIILLAFILSLHEPRYQLNCASHIEDLPAPLNRSVNDACHDYLRAQVLTKEQLSDYINRIDIRFINDPELPTRGAVRFEDGGISLRMNYLENDPKMQRTAYHEMAHIILWAAGVSTPDHHDRMHMLELCPGNCAWMPVIE